MKGFPLKNTGPVGIHKAKTRHHTVIHSSSARFIRAGGGAGVFFSRNRPFARTWEFDAAEKRGGHTEWDIST